MAPLKGAHRPTRADGPVSLLSSNVGHIGFHPVDAGPLPVGSTNNFILEMWARGLCRRFAKPVQSERAAVSSNLTVSAIIQAGGCGFESRRRGVKTET